MRKLQAIGKTSSRTGGTCQRTHVSAELKFQQQSQASFFRPTIFASRHFSTSRQKQRWQASTWCGSRIAASRISNSVYSTPSEFLPPLWARFAKSFTEQNSNKPAVRFTPQSETDRKRISSTCCKLPTLCKRNNCRFSPRIFFRIDWRPTRFFYKHSSTKIPFERSPDSTTFAGFVWRGSPTFSRHNFERGSKSQSGSFACLSGSQNQYSTFRGCLGRRDGLVSSFNESLVVGRHNGNVKCFSHFRWSQQKITQASNWRFQRFPDIRPLGKLFNSSSTEAAILLFSSIERFSESLRSQAWCRRTGSLGYQRDEKVCEIMESLSKSGNQSKTVEYCDSSNSQQIQIDSKAGVEIKRQIYENFVQKPEKKLASNLDIYKISRSSGADKQSGREGFKIKRNLEKNLSGKQIVKRSGFCAENDDYNGKPFNAGAKSDEFFGGNDLEFQSRIAAAKTINGLCRINFPNTDVATEIFLISADDCVRQKSCGGYTT